MTQYIAAAYEYDPRLTWRRDAQLTGWGMAYTVADGVSEGIWCVWSPEQGHVYFAPKWELPSEVASTIPGCGPEEDIYDARHKVDELLTDFEQLYDNEGLPSTMPPLVLPGYQEVNNFTQGCEARWVVFGPMPAGSSRVEFRADYHDGSIPTTYTTYSNHTFFQQAVSEVLHGYPGTYQYELQTWTLSDSGSSASTEALHDYME